MLISFIKLTTLTLVEPGMLVPFFCMGQVYQENQRFSVAHFSFLTYNYKIVLREFEVTKWAGQTEIVKSEDR